MKSNNYLQFIDNINKSFIVKIRKKFCERDTKILIIVLLYMGKEEKNKLIKQLINKLKLVQQENESSLKM